MDVKDLIEIYYDVLSSSAVLLNNLYYKKNKVKCLLCDIEHDREKLLMIIEAKKEKIFESMLDAYKRHQSLLEYVIKNI